MGQVQRLFLLSRLVDRAWDGLLAMSQPKSTVQIFAHARALLSLLDTLETEGLSLEDLGKAIPDEDAFADFGKKPPNLFAWCSRHFQELRQSGRISAAARRRTLLEIQAQQWRFNPPDHPVILAGTTATIPAVADLAKVIAHLQRVRLCCLV